MWCKWNEPTTQVLRRIAITDNMDTENLVLTVLGGLDQRLLFGALHDLPDALALGDFQLFQKVIQYRIQPVGGDFRPKSLNTHCHTFSHPGSCFGSAFPGGPGW